MQGLLVVVFAVLSSAAQASESSPSDAFGQLFPASPVACPDDSPAGCVCGEYGNLTDLPMRYSRFRHCPHPVLEDVVHSRTFTADGALIDDVMLKNGQLHGAVISWHPNGQVEGIANYRKGRQIGFARVWHANGNLAAEQRFDDGELHGIETRYDEAGRPQYVVVWEHGKPDRERTLELSERLGLESKLRGAAPGQAPGDGG